MSGGFQAPFLSISIAKPSGKYSIVKFIQPESMLVLVLGSSALGFLPSQLTLHTQEVSFQQPNLGSLRFLLIKWAKCYSLLMESDICEG